MKDQTTIAKGLWKVLVLEAGETTCYFIKDGKVQFVKARLVCDLIGILERAGPV